MLWHCFALLQQLHKWFAVMRLGLNHTLSPWPLLFHLLLRFVCGCVEKSIPISLLGRGKEYPWMLKSEYHDSVCMQRNMLLDQSKAVFTFCFLLFMLVTWFRAQVSLCMFSVQCSRCTEFGLQTANTHTKKKKSLAYVHCSVSVPLKNTSMDNAAL